MDYEYKIKILHFINPHLIWALVEDDGENNIHFEQIGIYGILPVSVELDYEGNITTCSSEEWMPAVYITMKKLLLEAKEVWFSVSLSDSITSIFDDNLHKFGDLIVIKKNGETVSMQQRLLDTSFAIEDTQNFQSNLNTKLDYVAMVTVIKKIRQSFSTLNISTSLLETVFKKQTMIFEETVQLEEKTPLRGLEIKYRPHHTEMVQQYIKDLNACKDVDEVSAGRACSIRTVKNIGNSGLLNKLNSLKLSTDTDMSPRVNVDNNLRAIEKSPDINQNVEKYVSKNKQEFNSKSHVKGKKQKQQDANKDKTFIAYGPSGLNTNQYVIKEKTTHLEQPKREEKLIETHEPDTSDVKNDIFESTDSEVNVKINVLDVLKKLRRNNKTSDYNTSNTDTQQKTQEANTEMKKSSLLQRKFKMFEERKAKLKLNSSSSTTETDTTRPGDDSDSESITALVDKLDLNYSSIKKDVDTELKVSVKTVKSNVNPFKNLDGSQSVFVEKLIRPSVMVHTKYGNRIQPVSLLRDMPFCTDIHIILRNMAIKKPMRPQSVSWPTILRGHSLFLVSPADSGKTIGYLPAVCQLVRDYRKMEDSLSVARLTCIILCATSNSVSYLEELTKMFLQEGKVFACYAGMSDISISTVLLNGCDILICTPCILVKLLRHNLGLDLRCLNTLVVDDCERISEVYLNELKYCLFKVKEMLKLRVNKEVKVQYVVASRIWCDFMSSLAKKAPDSVICIGGFQECVLYSKVNTSVEFLEKESKLNSVINFLKDIDTSKKTVIVCRSDDEVRVLEKALTDLKYVVFACDNTMTLHDLYNIDLSLSKYKEPVSGPILVCCDGNLTHLNITDAHYLIHFSLPELFSLFCKRFAVLIDHYQSIFDENATNVRIKVILENANVEQLPKILNFIKRCTDNVPSVLDEISTTVMAEKDYMKAKNYAPICNLILTIGKCPDIWNCRQRHALFQEFDEPREWMPKKGTVTFKILHFHSAVHYSARLISCVDENGLKKFPQTYNMLSVKLGMYYGKEVNRKLHGVAKPGDICAVSIKHNLFARCQVIKVLQYSEKKHPTVLLINLIDEEKYEKARDTCLYYLPDELKKIDTHVAKIVLANLIPQDRDLSYSRIIEDRLRSITENDDFYIKGEVSLAIGNCLFVETLEACQDLTSMNEVVVKNDFKKELLDGFALSKPDHLTTLEKLGAHLSCVARKVDKDETVLIPKPMKVLPRARWAHLSNDDYAPVYYLYANSPGQLFIQHVKFQDCLDTLLKEIKAYVSEGPEPVIDVNVGDIVLAEFPDDVAYERARIDSVIDSTKVKCFFVDLGDWRIVAKDKIVSITEKLITQLPFQAIECRLIGIKPPGNEWSEFSTNWMIEQFYDSKGDIKYLFAKRFTKEKAEVTGGDKYGIALIDTYADDVCINKMMIDTNLAKENEEFELLNNLDIEKVVKSSSDDDFEIEDDAAKAKPDQEAVESTLEKDKVKDNNENAVKRPKTEVPDNNKNLEPTFDNQIALKKGLNELDTIPKAALQDNRNPIMNIFRNSKGKDNYALEEEDDIDIDQWDSVNIQNAFINLLNKNNPYETEGPKIIPLEETAEETKDISTQKVKNIDSKKEISPSKKEKTKVDGQHSVINHAEQDVNWQVMTNNNSIILHDKAKKIKLIWTQEGKNITVNVMPSVTNYDVKINDKELKFYVKDEIGFELELYGVVDGNKYSHSNKGDHIEINLTKVISKKWFNLYVGDVKKLFGDEHTKFNKETNNVQNTEYTKDSLIVKEEIDVLRKPRIVWRQNKTKITIKILLITEKYNITIEDKNIKFNANANGEDYGFEFDLYGVIDGSKSTHANKGQYIQVNLIKIMAKNWLDLSIGNLKKWIVYDVDNIYVSSDEEDDNTDEHIEMLKKNIKFDDDSDSDGFDDFSFR